ncbi:copper amine oxidase [Arthrobacter sp. MYb229]|uniref:copper amine oxidase n=1 Tax=unclassified Arthrobacter TaxID=235627 RepID=UPI000CFB10BC|nr:MULTISPECIES: copper amine oxidase [unclassified Arthrobacter]PRA04418.1 copper amine oxidase [Arthrobacter sp. MYb229]PRB51668.1 copper amine oxidase [Arthrobacter sp. MYb216]
MSELVNRSLLRAAGLLAGAAVLVSCQSSSAANDQGTAVRAQADQGVTSRVISELSCSEGSEALGQDMTSGANWSMCFSVDIKLGMVLENVTFTPPNAEPMEIIDSMSLSQLEVPYDDGGRSTSDITSAGFGGGNMHSLTEIECPGTLVSHGIPTIGDGSKYGEIESRPVLCSDTVDGGLSYRSAEVGQLLAKRKNDWQLSTVSKVGWYEYLNQVTFGADGSIRPALGATGDLSPVDYSDAEHGAAVGEGEEHHASSHSHNAVWKIHWALGGTGAQQVEQYDTKDTNESGEQSPIVEGNYTKIGEPATAQWTDARWWKVSAPGMLNADGHVMSYEIDMGKTDGFSFIDDEKNHGADGATDYDVAFTNADDCHIYATYNRGTCGRGVLDFVKNQSGEKLADVVSWVAVGYHHVPRDEEQSPMEVHWQGFTMVPRDLTAQRLDVPEERSELNGKPEDWQGQLPPEGN